MSPVRSAGAKPARFVALVRGINVGTAKRVAMADLRALVEALGYRNAATLLNSGNVVFEGPAGAGGAAGPRRPRRYDRCLARCPHG